MEFGWLYEAGRLKSSFCTCPILSTNTGAASFGHSTATPELLMIDAEAASLNWRPVSFWSADASDFWRAVGVSCTSVSIVSQISDPCGEETPTRRTKAT